MIALIALILVVYPARAQDAADPLPDVTATLVSPADDSPVVVVQPVFNPGEIVGWLLIAITGGGTVAMVITRFDRRGKDETERLYQALPPIWQTTILKIVETAGAAVRLAKEVTDGKPNA